jgi:hypothetical protein
LFRGTEENYENIQLGETFFGPRSEPEISGIRSRTTDHSIATDVTPFGRPRCRQKDNGK